MNIMLHRLNILLSFLIALLVSCQSPTDLDTPRNKILPTPIDSVALSLVSMEIETNGEVERFVITNAMMEIDTSSSNPLIWGRLEINSDYIINFSKEKLFLNEMSLSLDNIPISGEPLILSKGVYGTSYAKYLISRGISAAWDKELKSDPMTNKSEISFSLDKNKENLWIYLDSQIYDNRVYLNSENTSEVDSVQDVLFIKARFKFNY